MINTQWKTCRPVYVFVVSNILSQVIFFLDWGGGNFNVLLTKLKQKKNKYKLQITLDKKLTTTYISIGTLQEAINQGTTLAAGMPTPGNLKSGDSLFCINESMNTMNQGTEKRRDTTLIRVLFKLEPYVNFLVSSYL